MGGSGGVPKLQKASSAWVDFQAMVEEESTGAAAEMIASMPKAERIRFRKTSLMAGDQLEDLVGLKEAPQRVRGSERVRKEPRVSTCSCRRVETQSTMSSCSLASPEHTATSLLSEGTSLQSEVTSCGLKLQGWHS